MLASDYLIRASGWDGMDGAGGSEDWMLDQWRNSGYRLVLGVPILPGGSGGTLAAGAAGAYNQYFSILAQTLVKDGAANAILRLGWEFNGTWYPWSVASNTDAQNFAQFWRQIVNTMRAVPGQQFKFLWNPNGGGTTSWNLELAYPGSAYVDYIGTDDYDEYWGSSFTPQASWSNAVTQTWGLNWLRTFAAAQGRPIAIPEWSVDSTAATATASGTIPISSTSSPTGSRPTTSRSPASSRSTTPPVARTPTSPTGASPMRSPRSTPTSVDRYGRP